MSIPEVLMLIVILSRLSANANLNAIGPIEQRVKREEKGCCVYKKPIWESSEDLWNMPFEEERDCHPGKFEVRRGCHFILSYDQQREMFLFTAIDSDEPFEGYKCDLDGNDKMKMNCSQNPDEAYKTVSARSAMLTYGYNVYHHPLKGAPYSDWNCLHYAGNDLKPTCHNFTNGELVMKRRLCIFIYDPTTQLFRFANRSCDNAQSLFTGEISTRQCYQLQDSWEYTCVGGLHPRHYKRALNTSNLPPTPVFCCNWRGFTTAQYGQSCKQESGIRVQPNVKNCHYLLEKNFDSDPITVLQMLEGGVDESSVNCTFHLKSLVRYDCQCPISITNSADCLTDMFEKVEKRFREQPPLYCCNYTNYLSTDASHLNKLCENDLLIRVYSNFICNYQLEKKSDSEPIKVTKMSTKDASVSSISCNQNEESDQQYNCGCPASKWQSPSDCLPKIFDRVAEIFQAKQPTTTTTLATTSTLATTTIPATTSTLAITSTPAETTTPAKTSTLADTTTPATTSTLATTTTPATTSTLATVITQKTTTNPPSTTTPETTATPATTTTLKTTAVAETTMKKPSKTSTAATTLNTTATVHSTASQSQSSEATTSGESKITTGQQQTSKTLQTVTVSKETESTNTQPQSSKITTSSELEKTTEQRQTSNTLLTTTKSKEINPTTSHSQAPMVTSLTFRPAKRKCCVAITNGNGFIMVNIQFVLVPLVILAICMSD